MNSPDIAITGEDLKALEAFVLDNSDLSTLEQRISQFNIFEALDIVHQEIRHSNFLAWLLDPAENHGLGANFLSAFLMHSLSKGRQLRMRVSSPVGVYGLNLEDTLLQREQDSIDILATNERARLVLVVENKVKSSEHDDQLERYARVVKTRYPQCEAIFVYLSPEGPSSLDDRYIPVTYQEIAKLVDRLLAEGAAGLAEPIRLVLTHYRDLLGRHIVPESDIAELCRGIYRKHKRALDLIFEHRPDLQTQIAEFLQELVRARDDLVLDRSPKGYIRFSSKSWDAQFLGRGSGWTPSGRLVLFEFLNDPKVLRLKLIIGPGEPSLRSKIFDLARTRKDLFQPSPTKLYDRWTTIMSHRILDVDQLETADWEAIRSQIEQRWSEFTRDLLPRIEKALREI